MSSTDNRLTPPWVSRKTFMASAVAMALGNSAAFAAGGSCTGTGSVTVKSEYDKNQAGRTLQLRQKSFH